MFLSKATKNLEYYQHQLSPESALHSNCDVEELKKQVKDVFDMISEIQTLVEMPEDLQEALKTIDKVILQKPKLQRSLPTSVAKEKRPQLVMEDLQDCIQDAHDGLRNWKI